MLALIVCIVGLVLYLVTLPSKVTEVGRICFGVGLLVFLLQYSNYFNYLIR